MQALFKLQHKFDCNVIVEGVEQDYCTYDDFFTYPDTITLNVLFRADIDEEGEETYKLEAYDINDHSANDISSFKINEDGLYVMSHYIIPRYDKIQYVDSLTNSKLVYAYDGQDIVKYINKKWEKVKIADFVELNITDNFTVAFCQDYLFSICHLKKCFFNINKELLSRFCGKDRCQTEKHRDVVYKRDLLWMGINTIDYLLDEDRYFEALNLLKMFVGCSGFCNDNNEYGSRDCGCRA